MLSCPETDLMMNSNYVTHRIAVVVFIGGLGGGLVFPILPALGLQLGISGIMIGLVLSANRIARLLFNAPAGHVITRLGPRITLTGALLTETIGVLGYSAALRFGHAVWWLLGGRVLFGIGTAFLLVGAQVAVLQISNKEDRGRKTAVVRVAIGMAMPGGLVLGGVLADVFSDNVAFLFGAGLTFLGAFLALIFLPTLSRSPDIEKPPVTIRQYLAMLFKLRPFSVLYPIWGFNFLVFLTVQGVLLSTMVVLVQHRQIRLFGMHSQGTSGLIMAVLMGGSAFMALIVGRVIDRLRFRTQVVVPSLIGLSIGFWALSFAHTVEMMLIGAALIGFSANGITLPMMALLGDVVQVDQQGLAVSIYQIFGDTGGIIGPIVGLVIGVRYSLAPLYIALAVLLLLSVSVVAWLHLQERRWAQCRQVGQ